MNLKHITILATIAYVILSQSVIAASWREVLNKADSFNMAGIYDSSLIYSDSAYQIAINTLSESDTVIVHIMHSMASNAASAGQPAMADSLYAATVQLKERLLGSKSPSLAYTLNHQAWRFIDSRQLDKAIANFTKASKIIGDVYGEKHEDYAYAISGLANCYLRQGKLDAAEEGFLQALKLRKELLGDRHSSVSNILYSLGSLAYKRYHIDKAVNYSEECLAIRIDFYGEIHPNVAKAYIMLGKCVYQQNRIPDAEKYYLKSIDIYTQLYGKDNRFLVDPLQILANLYWQWGKFDNAITNYEHCLEIYERQSYIDPLYLIGKKSLLALVYSESGDSENAVNLVHEVENLTNQQEDLNNVSIAWGFNCIAGVYKGVSRTKSLQYYKKALSIFNKLPGDYRNYIVWPMQNAGWVHMVNGEYGEAKSYLLKALELRNELSPIQGQNHAILFTWIAELNYYLGLFEEADSLFQLAHDLMINDYDNIDRTFLGTILGQFGELHLHLGNYSKAESLVERGLELVKSELGSEGTRIIGFLGTLGQIAHKKDKDDHAISYYNRVIDICLKSPSDSVFLFWPIMNMANLYRDSDHLYIADSLYDEAYILLKNSSFSKYYGIIENSWYLSERGAIKKLQDDLEGAIDYSHQAYCHYNNITKQSIIGLTENEALRYVRHKALYASKFLSCFSDLNNGGKYLSDIISCVLSAKGTASDQILWRNKKLRNAIDPVIVGLIDSLRVVRTAISDIFVISPQGGNVKTIDELNSLHSVSLSLEAKLAELDLELYKHQEIQTADITTIRPALPDGATLVEYYKWSYSHPIEDNNETRYSAIILNKNKRPVYLNLGSALTIDSLVSEYRRHLLGVSRQGHYPTRDDFRAYKEISSRLYQILLKPVVEYLSQSEITFLAPDAGLNLISFAGLVDNEGSYFIEKYPIHYISSGRDLIRLQDKRESNTGLFALGDPDFNASIDARLESAEKYFVSTDTLIYQTRSIRSECGDLSTLTAKQLPSTRNEINDIELKWAETTPNYPAIVFLGSQATEDNFKNNAPNKQNLHIATHGYYIGEDCAADISERQTSESRYIGENPMLLSGLLLAGCNHHGEGADEAGLEDGFLSAYEVSSLNLDGTDMVVLSACETGIGDIKNGEDVYGLRRAFQMAGTRTVVSALWPVPDKQTAAMMSELYKKSTEPLPDKMRRIQIFQINKIRSMGLANHPLTWGAFVAMGDWR